MKSWILLSCAATMLTACLYEPPREIRVGVPAYISEEPVTFPTYAPLTVCPPLPHSAPLVSGADVTLTICDPTIRLQPGGKTVLVRLPPASDVAGMRWTIKMWGDDANHAIFVPFAPSNDDADTMSDTNGNAPLETTSPNQTIVIEAFDGVDGHGWMVLAK